MNEKLICIPVTLVEPTEGSAAPAAYFYTPVDLTIIMVTGAPHVDDAGLTIDISDDGTDVIAAISAAVAATPGTWKATGYGGTNDKVTIAAGSKVGVNANNQANGTAVQVYIFALTGDIFS